MKLKKLLKGIFTTIFSICMAMGIGGLISVAEAKAETAFTEKDVTLQWAIKDNRTVVGDDTNVVFVYVTPKENCGAYYNPIAEGEKTRWILTDYDEATVAAAGSDILSLLEINGTSVRAILNDDTIPTYTAFNGGDGTFDTKSPPVMVVAEGSFNDFGFGLYIHKDYIKSVNDGTLDGFTFTFKNGIVWNTVDGYALKNSDDVVFTYGETTNTFVLESKGEIDVTKKTKIHYWATSTSNGTANPSNTFLINFGQGVNVKPYATSGAYHIYLNDNATKNECDVMSYVQLNGVTLRSIVGDNGKAGSNSWQASTGDGFGLNTFVPVQLKSWDYSDMGLNGFELLVTQEYIDEACGGIENLKITVMEGIAWRNTDNKILTTTQTITYKPTSDAVEPAVNVNKYFEKDLEKVDITDSVTIPSNVQVTENATYWDIYGIMADGNGLFNFTNTWAPFSGERQDNTGKGVQLWLNDNATTNACDLASYIYLNGKSIRAYINAGGYTEKTQHFMGLSLCADGIWGGLRLQVTKEWLTKYNNGTLEGLEITLKTGFEWDNVELKTFYTTGDIAWEYKDGVFSRFVRRTYTVTFDGGEPIEILGGEKLSQNQIPENPIKESTAETEYTFKGWYYTDTDGEEYIFKPDKYPVMTDMELYPKFTSANRKYIVTLLKEDGTVYATQEVAHGATIELQDVPVKEGYTGEWIYQGDGKEPLSMPMQNIVYKVQYTATEHPVDEVPKENGCGAAIVGVPLIGLVTAVCALTIRRKKRNGNV